MQRRKIRLKDFEIFTIKDIISSIDSEADIYIFGSRVRENKKGGDIDILVISDKISWREKRKIRVELIKKLGDRKIDLIVEKKESKNPFVKLAIKEGIKI